MIHTRTFSLLLVPMLAVGSAQAQDAIVPAKATKLFNGTDLAGLTTWLKDTKRDDPRKVFRIADGLLHITGEGFGYLATKDAYRDYHVTLEFQWGDKTDGGKYVRNSGILLHGTGPDGGAGGTWMASVECQLAQGCVGDLIAIRGQNENKQAVPVQFTSDITLGPDKRPRWSKGGTPRVFGKGQLWWHQHDPDFKELLDTRGKNDVESPKNEWTRVECLCSGKTITVLVNGTTVNHCYDVTPAAGKIMLQCEGFELKVRRWDIAPLAK